MDCGVYIGPHLTGLVARPFNQTRLASTIHVATCILSMFTWPLYWAETNDFLGNAFFVTRSFRGSSHLFLRPIPLFLVRSVMSLKSPLFLFGGEDVDMGCCIFQENLSRYKRENWVKQTNKWSRSLKLIHAVAKDVKNMSFEFLLNLEVGFTMNQLDITGLNQMQHVWSINVYSDEKFGQWGQPVYKGILLHSNQWMTHFGHPLISNGGIFQIYRCMTISKNIKPQWCASHETSICLCLRNKD